MDAPAPSRRRLVTFRAVTTVVALLFLLAVPNVLAAWVPISLDPAIADVQAARWHTVVEGTGDTAGIVLLVALLLRPRRNPLVPLSYAIAVVVASLTVLPFTGPSLLFAIGPVLAVLLAYPYWPEVRGLIRAGIRWHWGLLVPAFVAAAALAGPIAGALVRQIAGVGAMAAANEWATYAEHLTTLVLCAFLAATRLPGWRLFAGVQGTSWIYLGIAAAVLGERPDSWGLAGGFVAVGAGLAVLAVAVRTRPAAEPVPVTA